MASYLRIGLPTSVGSWLPLFVLIIAPAVTYPIMASYLRSWYTTVGLNRLPSSTPSPPPTPSLTVVSPPSSDDEGEETETEGDKEDDRPPAFPSLNSAQRISSTKTISPKSSASTRIPNPLRDAQLMPPPPVPILAKRTPAAPSPSVRLSPAAPGPGLHQPSQTKEKPVEKHQDGNVSLAASYLRSWLPISVGSWLPFSMHGRSSAPSVTISSPPPSDDEGEATETEEVDDDSPPAFPLPNSAQRISSSSAAKTSSSSRLPNVLRDNRLMPPPPAPGLAKRTPGAPAPSARLSPAASGPGLLQPLQTTKKPTKKYRDRKVALEPGHSPLDWAALKTSGKDLRGVHTLARISPSMLKLHNKKDDAWTAVYGKVYNITSYLPFHPGGPNQIMRAAGRDGTKLFATTHAWVNVDFMLDECLVGFLVPEPAS